MGLFFLILVPALVALGFLLLGKGKVTLREFIIQLVAQGVFIAIIATIIYYANVRDAEILNGYVTGKKREVVSCEHSYTCNCYTTCSGSGTSQTCSTHCSTCWEHSYDIAWRVYTSIDRTVDINRTDRQGLNEPPRWTKVVIGEPFSTTHTYENYIKAAPGTIFRRDADYSNYKNLPEYPDNVYDYYRLNRLVQVGVALPNAKELSQQLSQLNAELGARKQVNIILVVVKGQPEEWFYALESKWIGGKKNDVVVVVSVDDQLEVRWVNVMAWTNDATVKVAIPARILYSGLKDVIGATRDGVEYGYKRKPMSEFEYLKASIVPSETQMAVSLFLSLLFSVGLGVFFYKMETV
jgi:hypothetical protein